MFARGAPIPTPARVAPLECLRTTVASVKAQPAVLVACGSFSPITNMHLRIFEDARDDLAQQSVDVIGGYVSPTHAKYGKASLASMPDRLNMTQLALQSSSWVNLSSWECAQSGWTRTAVVLQHFADELAQVPLNTDSDAKPEHPVKVMLLCGGDLLDTFDVIKDDGEPLWLPQDRETILRNGIVCIERKGTDLQQVIAKSKELSKYKENIYIIKPQIENDISSSSVRRLLAQGRSIKYLVPDDVIAYIKQHSLHELPTWKAQQ
ncbi:hypothetical protein PTSG_08369 [Salpingoeca rosetta]|uniref:Nicotinamide-nucleotide adenylyltransferase n=1 Tax=Salpingoeca rosetta (strain ATCC 50818 / BSB-021) TaxID=946362 RepID=F2UJH7_SALR5|nr:uncharacterized protein PTSG_08369 [Salpingoeca rosetta]EGD77276.1 hypothetical protein PTSG_08369 [Salpingoeca rosetta]|eukprot:XP_004990620.1 hypothetical protein PTSG_08369 [Salpingoeca rosetta]